MHYNHKFSVIGFIIGNFAIIFGIVAFTTPTWVRINYNQTVESVTCSLFQQCTQIECVDINHFQAPQYMEIIGYILLVIGFIIGVLCTACIAKRSIHFISPIIILIGSITIFLGCIFYIKYIAELNPDLSIKSIDFGYSMIMMISTCIIGCFLTGYFSFTAGYIHRHILGSVPVY